MKIILAEKLELNKFRHFIIFVFFIINDNLYFNNLYIKYTFMLFEKNVRLLRTLNS